MKKKLFASAAFLAALGSTASTASAQEVLTGDTRLACEAIICLATGNQPSECTPSLRRYFSISHRRLRDTLRGRTNFLRMCPVANQSPQMQALVNAQINGAGRCDAQSLNATLVTWRGYDDSGTYISNQMPDYCASYMGHAYTDFNSTVPRYVGTPERGGHWVEARDYDRALAEYNERIRREDEQRGRDAWMN